MLSVCHSNEDFRLSSFVMSYDQSSKWSRGCDPHHPLPHPYSELWTGYGSGCLDFRSSSLASQIFRAKPLKIRTSCEMSTSSLYGCHMLCTPLKPQVIYGDPVATSKLRRKSWLGLGGTQRKLLLSDIKHLSFLCVMCIHV